MRKQLHYILFIVLFIIYAACYQDVLSHIIFYQEQHHLFLFSTAYFTHSLHTEGWMSWLTDFLIQFFHLPLLGSCLMAGILSSVYLLVRFIIYRITGKRDLLQLALLPSLYLFLQTVSADASLVPVVSVWVSLLVVAVFCWLLSPWLRKLHRLIPDISLKPAVYWAVTVIVLLVYGGGTFYKFLQKYDIREYRMLKAEQAVKERNWDDVLMQTEKYLKRQANNQLIFYFRNMALYHTGQLLDHLLDYPLNMGVKALYFPWNSDSRESEYGHLLYEDLGYINEAQRWEFEAMVVWGETAPHLLNLARYNVVNKRPEVARRFINLLKQSLFYRKEAEQLEAALHTGKVPGLRAPLADVKESPARFANVLNIGPELQYLCEKDSTNRMAFEYLMCDLLLSNQVVRFVDNLKYMRHFDYPRMPRLFEEALFMYRSGVGEEEFSKTGYSVSPETEEHFKHYYQLYQQKDMRKLRLEFGNSYWYYLNFVSPYGNKIIAR